MQTNYGYYIALRHLHDIALLISAVMYIWTHKHSTTTVPIVHILRIKNCVRSKYTA